MPKFSPIHSLRFRVTAGILIPLVILLAVLAYVRHITYQRLLLERLQQSASRSGELIESSLRHAMLTNNRASTLEIIRDIGAQEDVRRIFLLDKQGRVAMSAGDPVAGSTLALSDPTCQICHQDSGNNRDASGNQSVILSSDRGTRALRNVNAIENAPECRSCHGDAGDAPLGVLVSDFELASMDRALATERRNSLLWSAGYLVLILLVVDFMLNRMVLRWLTRLVQAIRHVIQGDLSVRLNAQSPAEYQLLANAFNTMTNSLREKHQLEQQLQHQTRTLETQTKRLEALNHLASTVSQSLDLAPILHDALDEVLASTRLQAGWVLLQDDRQEDFYLAAWRGEVDAPQLFKVPCLWDQCDGWQVLRSGHPQVTRAACLDACPEASDSPTRFDLRLCVPLKAKERVLGIMSLAGNEATIDQELLLGAMDFLTAIGRQVGLAVENARLYEALRHKEQRQRQLLDRLITVQEEERRRIARELHDQTGQPLSSLIMTLDVLERPSLSASALREHVRDLRAMATGVLDQVHELALELRPSALDDLGLWPALRNLLREYQSRFGIPVDLQVLGLADQRLPSEVETVLYRIIQEALNNVARHASAKNVGILLQNRGDSVALVVEDDGRGFDVAAVMGSRPQQGNLGLHGMQERAALVGGTLTIESVPGKGTALFVEIPLGQKEQDA